MTSSGDFEFVLSNQSDIWFQISVIQFLQKMGFVFLDRDDLGSQQSMGARGMLLEVTLRDQLRRINQSEFKGGSQCVNERKLSESIRVIRAAGATSDCTARQRVLHCVLGTRNSQGSGRNVEDRGVLKFIDWENPHRNTFHIAANFLRNESPSSEIVCFVNGIPLALIACSRNQAAFGLCGNSMTGRQGVFPRASNNGFLQLLFALARNRLFYTAVSEPCDAWHEWRADGECHASLIKLIRSPPQDEHQECLFGGPFAFARVDFERDTRIRPEPMGFERFLWELFQPARLLDLIGKFLVRDRACGQGIVASQSEILAVTKTTRQMSRRKHLSGRQGGFLWLPVGVRKPLLLSFLARALVSTEVLSQKRLWLLSGGDREECGWDLSLTNVLRRFGEEVGVLQSLSECCGRLNETQLLVSSIDLLFATLESESSGIESLSKHECLVVVSFCPRKVTIEQVETLHRSFPGWCFLFVSDRAPSREWKRVMSRFGGMIDSGYTYAQSIKEGALVPAYYESRLLGARVSGSRGDSVDAASIPLMDSLELSVDDGLDGIEDASFLEKHLRWTACDISQSCASGVGEIQGCGLVVVATLKEALMLKAYFDEIGEVGCRLGRTVGAVWESRGQERAYHWGVEPMKTDSETGRVSEREVVVVSREQLDYLDDSRFTVVYLVTQLSGPELLGAICAASRSRYGKDFSVVVEYVSSGESLEGHRSAIASLSSVYGRRCIVGLCHDLQTELISLPDRLRSVRESIPRDHNEFACSPGKGSIDDPSCRARFFREFLQFHRRLLLATASPHWREGTPISMKNSYGRALVELENFRNLLEIRFSETSDYMEFELQLKRLINMVGEVKASLELPAELNAFNRIQFERDLACMPSPRARIDMIVHRMLRELSDASVETPEFYCRVKTELMAWIGSYKSNPRAGGAYSECLAWALKQFQATKLFGTESLLSDGSSSELLRDAVTRTIGPKLTMNETGEALILSEAGNSYALNKRRRPQMDPQILLLVDQLESLVQQHRTSRWRASSDFQNRLRNDLDDCLLEFQARENLRISVPEMDLLIDAALKILI